MKWIVCALAVLGGLGSAAGEARAAAFQVATGARPDVAVDSAGNGHFTWTETDSNGASTRTLYCKVPRGGADCPSAGRRELTAPFGHDVVGSYVMVSGSRVVVLTHRCCTDNYQGLASGNFLFVSEDGGTTFSNAVLAGPLAPSYDAILGPGDSVSVFGFDGVSAGAFANYPLSGTNSSAAARVGGGYGGDLTLRDGKPFLVTLQFGPDQVYWRQYSGSGDMNDAASWGPVNDVEPTSSRQHLVESGPTGTFLLELSATDSNYGARTFDGTAFGAPVPLGRWAYSNGRASDLFADPSGRLHVMWLGDGDVLRYRTSADGRTWSPTFRLSDQAGSSLGVAAAPDGKGFATWQAGADKVMARALEDAPQEPPPPGPPSGPGPAANDRPALLPGACANVKRGTGAGDMMEGTEAGDRLIGGSGDDDIVGLAGDDCLEGGVGRDDLDGGEGDDTLDGGKGPDELEGGPGNDTLIAGRARNRLSGGPGRDRLNSVNAHRDVVDCGPGRDRATVDRRDRVRGCERVTRRRGR